MLKMRIIVLVILLLLMSVVSGTQAQDDVLLTAFDIQWSPDGEWLGFSSTHGVWIYDADDLSAEPIQHLSFTQVSAIAFDNTGNYIAVSNNLESTVTIFEISTGRIYRAFDTPYSLDLWAVFYDIRFSADNQFLLVANTSILYVFDVESGDTVATYDFIELYPDARITWVSSVSSTDRQGVFATINLGSTFNVFDINEGIVGQFELEPELGISITSYLSASSYLLLGYEGIYQFDTSTEDLTLIEQPLADGASGFGLNADNTLLATGGRNEWMLYDLEADELLYTVTDLSDEEYPPAVFALRFNPDSTQIATLQAGGVATIWDTETGEIIDTLDVFDNAYNYRWG